MTIVKLLPALPVVLAGLAMPSLAAPPRPSAAAKVDACMAPTTFLTALSDAGDWIIKRDPTGPDAKVTGVAFRHDGMIDVAVFKSGCLAMVVIVGQAAPDLQV